MGENERPAGAGAANNEYEFWLDLRGQLLGIVSLIERRKLDFNVTTAQKCKEWMERNVSRIE